ncbi:MAG TPA: hypothetical protein VGB53_11240 [Rubricoccaceae bacterium]|jgi:hypothetical protein
MSRLILLTAAVVALAGCSELGYAQDVYNRIPGSTSRDRYERTDDYARTTEYRRITSDAADYARRVDDALRIGSAQERRIRDLLTDRTARLLQRTSPRDHQAVYPFPRRFSGDSRAARAFWTTADRDIERLLDRQDADLYRRYVRAGGRYDNRDYNRRYDGQDDRRYDDRGRDDGERDGATRDSDRRTAPAATRDGDRRADPPARRDGESLIDWYRRIGRTPR